jgi:hypothetical protein
MIRFRGVRVITADGATTNEDQMVANQLVTTRYEVEGAVGMRNPIVDSMKLESNASTTLRAGQRIALGHPA